MTTPYTPRHTFMWMTSLYACLVALLIVAPALAQDTTDPAAEPVLTAHDAPRSAFPFADDLTIAALRELEIEASEIVFEQRLADGVNYNQYIASYRSEGFKIYGLLTIPFGIAPEGGYKAIVFNHGYIPPTQYRTTERYVAYVDALARAGFVVFKIDMRGHGNSEGVAIGSYFSPAYTIDAISALKSLQTLDFVDPQGIGMWGHSMAGNLVMRAMLIEPDIKAGVIWAGAVYSYDDLARYSITDTSFVPTGQESPGASRRRAISEAYGQIGSEHPFWTAISLTANIDHLENPVQIHHAVDDDVVTVRYSVDLAAVLIENDKPHEFYSYQGGGHNISSPYFDLAMERTIAFFRAHL